MAQLVADCPRCGANKITFDLVSAIKTRFRYNWQNWYEAFCICRNCSRSTTFVLSESVDADYNYVHKTGLVKIEGSVNRFVDIEGKITLKDTATVEPPEFVPELVEAVFREASTCLAVSCYNAAGAMFRLCIDLVTLDILPDDSAEGPNAKTKRSLGLRLPWLFDNGYLPESLRELSSCVKEDGNDAAHAGNLTKTDAEDLLDFTTVLLERIYTEPNRIQRAQERREQRRKPDG